MKASRLARQILRRFSEARSRPFPGPLAVQILDRLSSEVFRGHRGDSTLYVSVKAVEKGGHPIHEDFGVKFQLVDSPAATPDQIVLSDRPIGVSERISSEGLPGGRWVVLPSDLFFHFSGAWSLDENLRRFRRFAEEQATRAASREDFHARAPSRAASAMGPSFLKAEKGG